MRLRRAVLQTCAKSSVPPGLPFYKSRPLRIRSESTLPQLLIPLHFNSPRINVYKKPGEGVPLRSPKVLQLVTHNSQPTQHPRHARHAILAIHHSSLATIPFRMIFFAHPHPLTTMESYSCKKAGEGVPGVYASFVFALLDTHLRRKECYPQQFLNFTHSLRKAPGGIGVCSKPFRRWIRRRPGCCAENWRWIPSAFEDNRSVQLPGPNFWSSDDRRRGIFERSANDPSKRAREVSSSRNPIPPIA